MFENDWYLGMQYSSYGFFPGGCHYTNDVIIIIIIVFIIVVIIIIVNNNNNTITMLQLYSG